MFSLVSGVYAGVFVWGLDGKTRETHNFPIRHAQRNNVDFANKVQSMKDTGLFQRPTEDGAAKMLVQMLLT